MAVSPAGSLQIHLRLKWGNFSLLQARADAAAAAVVAFEAQGLTEPEAAPAS